MQAQEQVNTVKVGPPHAKGGTGSPGENNATPRQRFFFDSTMGFLLGIVGLLVLMLVAIAIVVLLVGQGQ
jgi:hypothetical protein